MVVTGNFGVPKSIVLCKCSGNVLIGYGVSGYLFLSLRCQDKQLAFGQNCSVCNRYLLRALIGQSSSLSLSPSKNSSRRGIVTSLNLIKIVIFLLLSLYLYVIYM